MRRKAGFLVCAAIAKLGERCRTGVDVYHIQDGRKNYIPNAPIGDLDGDGIDDLAVPNHVDNTVTIYLGEKGGLRQAEGSPLSVGHGPTCVAIGDLNADGKPDLVVSHADDDDILTFFAR